jgi:hypothetical protein
MHFAGATREKRKGDGEGKNRGAKESRKAGEGVKQMEDSVTRRKARKEVRKIKRGEGGNNTIASEKGERGKKHRFVAIK